MCPTVGALRREALGAFPPARGARSKRRERSEHMIGRACSRLGGIHLESERGEEGLFGSKKLKRPERGMEVT